MLLMTSATILSKNVYGALTRTTDENAIARLARRLVPVIALVAVFFTLRGGEELVPLLLLGYNLVIQLAPALYLSLPERPRVTKAGAIAGVLAGEATIASLQLSGTTLAKVFPTWPSAITDLNIGVVALVVNVAVLVAVGAATRRPAPADSRR
jgi:SSS family solute:Na+ symporter